MYVLLLLYGLLQVRAFLFASGFSMAFGAMFTKTYRVHQIFTRANRGLIKSKVRFIICEFEVKAMFHKNTLKLTFSKYIAPSYFKT